MEYTSDYDQIWFGIRSEFYDMNKKACESILRDWLNKIGYTKPVGYCKDYLNREMLVYTTNPGILIGKRGSSVKEFERIMSEKFSAEWKVRFIEVRGGFFDPMGMKKKEVFDELLSTIDEWKQNSDMVSLDTVSELIKSKCVLFEEV